MPEYTVNTIEELLTIPSNTTILYIKLKIDKLDIVLPSNLEKLYCDNCGLTELPTLPDELEILDCSNNKLTKLPYIPKNITELNCDGNNLTMFPNISHCKGLDLDNLQCTENPFDEAVSDILTKYINEICKL